jgi:hypothetical protein
MNDDAKLRAKWQLYVSQVNFLLFFFFEFKALQLKKAILTGQVSQENAGFLSKVFSFNVQKWVS